MQKGDLKFAWTEIMKENRKNNKRHIEDIKRYLNDEMTPGERNSFERKLESDPFLSGAVEGYAHIDGGEAAEDIDALQKRIKSRTKRKSTLVYRVAAAIVALLVISSVLLVKNFRQTGQQIAENREMTEKKAPELPLGDPSESKPGTTEDLAPGKQEVTDPDTEKPETGSMDTGRNIVIEHEIIPAVDKVEDVEETVDLSDLVAAGKAEKAGEIEADDRDTGVTDERVTLKKAARVDEVVALKMAAIEMSRDARPLIEQEEYREYLAEKQVYPSGYKHMGRVTVSMEIIVNPDGSTGEIRVLESPGKAFSDEAIRLVREGPAWLPALKDGEAVRDTVKLELIFLDRRD
ncbi:MAG TPA: hypothetical protein ENH59_07925 [Bacteroidetes bacterium]|nr:hypothetical protein [Bacteroidota bacterium]